MVASGRGRGSGTLLEEGVARIGDVSKRLRSRYGVATCVCCCNLRRRQHPSACSVVNKQRWLHATKCSMQRPLLPPELALTTSAHGPLNSDGLTRQTDTIYNNASCAHGEADRPNALANDVLHAWHSLPLD